jgi:recombination protein RecR
MSTSPLIRQLIEALQCLSGVGPKTAQRMTFDLLERRRREAQHLANTILQSIDQIKHCQRCRTWSENSLCKTCANTRRDTSMLCVVESPADELAIEQTGIYSGYYFVLMGHLSPLDGIGPNEVGMKELQQLVTSSTFKEIILATNHTVEGDTTAHYIAELLTPLNKNLKLSRIAHGIPLGGELELTDPKTLASAVRDRVSMLSSS